MSSTENRSFLRGCLTAALCLAATLPLACDRSPASSSGSGSISAADKTNPTFKVLWKIEFGGRRPDLEGESVVAKETTVFEVLEVVSAAFDLVVESRGQGETRFVLGIGGFRNEGAGKDNWVYRVDGQLGDRSSGAFLLKDGQRVIWSLGDYPAAGDCP